MFLVKMIIDLKNNPNRQMSLTQNGEESQKNKEKLRKVDKKSSTWKTISAIKLKF